MKQAVSVPAAAMAAVVHEDGESWGIEIENEDEPQESGVVSESKQLLKSAGLEQKYDATKEATAPSDFVRLDGGESVEDLSAALAAL